MLLIWQWRSLGRGIMIKPNDPRQLAIDLLPRSTCNVQVAATISDGRGIFAWGWNNPGKGFGECAEAAAIRRANKERLLGSVIFVAGRRNRNGKIVGSKPCDSCKKKIVKNGLIAMYRDSDGEWRVL
jgi:deoxycytidylate deaminase